ncbi:hypothetical protein [Corallococcus llansteffanensis]|uniref:hypothetical protein n=1 Tax=Corallococcus llansteffanensis TaxID=2316731 RepID=UPI0011C496E2|nr:hypothetical protein [Corallococcus llansteffanensis]
MAIHLDVLTEKARIVTRAALARYPSIPERLRKELVLGTYFEGTDRVFELYCAGDRPQDAIVLTRVTVSAVTGEVGPVEVLSEHWCGSAEEG